MAAGEDGRHEIADVVRECLSVSSLMDVPSVEQIGKIIAVQGAVLNGIGLELIGEARQMDGAKKMKRLNDATRILSASAKMLSESAEILREFEEPPEAVRVERERLLELAYAKGYEVGFDADGTLFLEQMAGSKKLRVTSV